MRQFLIVRDSCRKVSFLSREENDTLKFAKMAQREEDPLGWCDESRGAEETIENAWFITITSVGLFWATEPNRWFQINTLRINL